MKKFCALILSSSLWLHSYAHAESIGAPKEAVSMPDLTTFNTYVPLSEVVWTGAHFVVTANSCNYQSKLGMWVFNENGGQVRGANSCGNGFDNGFAPGLWAHYWSLAPRVHVLDKDTIVHAANVAGSGHAYPLLKYNLAGPLNLVSRSWTLTEHQENEILPAIYWSQNTSIPRFHGGTLLAGQNIIAQTRNVRYSYSGGDLSSQVLTGQPDIIRGDLGLGRYARYCPIPEQTSLCIYQMHEDGTSDRLFNIGGGGIRSAVEDPLVPGRVAVVTSNEEFLILHTVDGETTIESTQTIPDHTVAAVAANYTIFVQCVQPAAGNRADSCTITVEKDGAEVATRDIEEYMSNAMIIPWITGIAVSDIGTIALLSKNMTRVYPIHDFAPDTSAWDPAPPGGGEGEGGDGEGEGEEGGGEEPGGTPSGPSGDPSDPAEDDDRTAAGCAIVAPGQGLGLLLLGAFALARFRRQR